MAGRIEELRTLIERHAVPDMSTPIPGIMIARNEISAHEQTMSGTVMALVAQGAKRIALGNKVYEYRPGQYLVARASAAGVSAVGFGFEE